ncbi:hypothetical protein [Clostridium sp. YIM B02569]|uniref:hypothetical protein n=1 Tax=Clostridium sp. YIM B02569 TaxID=2911967 RepID=UPI001EEC6623|nr:hypothetical protein [Clostridium sp. YIM B02569]
MDDLIAFISKFQGIFGTLLGSIFGVITTLITTQLIKNLGKIQFYFYDYEIKYHRYNQEEYDMEVIEDAAKAEYGNFKMRMQLYNNSEIMKILRDVSIEFELESKVICLNLHNSELTERTQFHTSTKDITIINIPPKQIIEFNVDGDIDREIINEFVGVKKAYFTGINHRNKKIKKLIKEF